MAELFEVTVTPDALRSAWFRYREHIDSLPLITDVLGKDLALEWEEEVTCPERPVTSSEPAPELVLPPEARPSEIPPDHNVAADEPHAGFLICTSDHHHSISDRVAEAAVMKLAQDLKPQTWVFNGDVIDAWWISRHDKEADRLFDADAGARIVDELASFRPYGAAAAQICKTVYVGEGNHEKRLSALINANPGLHGLPGLRWARLFDLPENVKHLDYGYRLRIGPVTFVHGDRIGGRFGVKYPCGWVLDNQGSRNVLFGHSHRLQSHYRTTWDENGQPHVYTAMNTGHLSDVAKQRYASEPNWQQGFSVIEFYTEAGRLRFTPHLIPIVDGRFSFAGRVYDGRRA